METKFLPFLLGVVSALLLLITPPARAAGTIYTNASEFLAMLEDGYYTEYFSDFSNYSSEGLSATLTNGTYTAVVTAKDMFGGSMYPYTTDIGGNDFLTVGGGSTFAKTITLTFTSGNINAIGGSFFYTNPRDPVVGAFIKLTFSDGTEVDLLDQNNTSFFGYIGSAPITSLTITSDATHHYGSIDNLILGNAVIPEPSTVILLFGGASLAFTFLPRDKHNRRRTERQVGGRIVRWIGGNRGIAEETV